MALPQDQVPWISKSLFKSKALEYFRHVETSGETIVVTDHGHPTLEIRPYEHLPNSELDPLDQLRNSVISYIEPTEPVDQGHWEALQ